MKRQTLLLALGVALLSVLVIGTTLFDTRVGYLTETESDALIVAMNRLSLVVGPVSVLLFAAAVHWAATKRYGLALIALPALPVWSLVLIELPTFTGQLRWSGLYLAHAFRGLQPFGAPPT